MKSKDVKNWSYGLSYSQMTELDDFVELLMVATAKDSCLLCGGSGVLNWGLCIECDADTKNRKAIEKVKKDYEVSRLVKVKKIR